MSIEDFIYNGGGISDEKGMLKAIKKMEKKKNKDWVEEFNLGIAYRNFATWHRHYHDNQQFLESAISHFKESIELAKNEPLFYEINHNREKFLEELSNGNIDGWKTEKLEVYTALIDLIRGKRFYEPNLVKDLSEEILSEYPGFSPCLWAYVDILYSEGKYEEAMKVLMDLRYRYSHDIEWRGGGELKYANTLLAKIKKKLDSQ